MGVEWIVACEDRKEIFELGKGPWEKLDGIITEAMEDSEPRNFFIRRVVETWLGGDDAKGKAPGFQVEYAHRVGSKLWLWCEQRDWKVKVANDAIGDFGYEMTMGWMITGTRFENAAFEPVPAPSLVRANTPAIGHLRSIFDSLTREVRMDALLARCILELDDRLRRVEAHVPRSAGLYRLARPDEPPDVDAEAFVRGCSEGMDLIFKTIKPRPGVQGEKPVFDFHAMRPVGTSCSVCGEIQFDSPSGPVCKNGHGGAPPKEE